MKHKTKTIELNGEKVRIDNNIVELIQLFNNYTNLKTRYCCENLDNHGFVQIMFDLESLEQVIDFFKEHKFLLNLCNEETKDKIKNYLYQKTFGNIDKSFIPSFTEILIPLDNYNKFVDYMYNVFTKKIYYHSVFVYEYSEDLNKSLYRPDIYLFNNYEEKEYNRDKLLDNIASQYSTEEKYKKVIQLNDFYYIKIKNKWKYTDDKNKIYGLIHNL